MAIRKPRVKLLRDGRLYGKSVKAGDVVEVTPEQARRLIGRRAAEQVTGSPAPAEAPKPTQKGKTE